jgi:hypothetical protein
MELLQQAMLAHTDDSAIAFDACFIAIGAIRSGNLELAKKNLALARKLDPKCWMLERTKREVEQVPQPSSA